MTMKTKWRLAKLPTPDELRGLVADKIITNEEAREILISQEKDSDPDVEGLKAEIKFLRELVQKLSNNSRLEIVKQIEYIEKPYKRWDWYEPYKWYCNMDNAIYSTAGSNIDLKSLGNAGTIQALNMVSTSDLNSMIAPLDMPSQDFTSIKTF